MPKPSSVESVSLFLFNVDYVTFYLCMHLVAGSVLKITKHLTNILVNFGWNVSLHM